MTVSSSGSAATFTSAADVTVLVVVDVVVVVVVVEVVDVVDVVTVVAVPVVVVDVVIVLALQYVQCPSPLASLLARDSVPAQSVAESAVVMQNKISGNSGVDWQPEYATPFQVHDSLHSHFCGGVPGVVGFGS